LVKDSRKKVIFLIGPTAIGKSRLALSLAKRLGAEIVSCDSMQVYRGFDIISSQPSPRDRKAVAHHLIDAVPARRPFSVSDYRKMALKKIKQIHSRGKIPLFVGGTGLYMSILLDGIFKEAGGKGEVIRQRLLKSAEKRGKSFLYNRLKSVDPSAAQKIHPNDLRRIVRALEVYEKTGRPISYWQKQRKGICDAYDVKVIGLAADRGLLYERINKRVDSMIRSGLVEEVRHLLKRGLSRASRAAIGIAEIKAYLEGALTLEEAIELIKKNTRRYAKRQMTYFRKDKRIHWLKIKSRQPGSRITSGILRLVRRDNERHN